MKTDEKKRDAKKAKDDRPVQPIELFEEPDQSTSAVFRYRERMTGPEMRAKRRKAAAGINSQGVGARVEGRIFRLKVAIAFAKIG